MTPRLIIFAILAAVAMVCLTIIICVGMIVHSNERQQERFLVHVPEKPAGT